MRWDKPGKKRTGEGKRHGRRREKKAMRGRKRREVTKDRENHTEDKQEVVFRTIRPR